MVTCIECGGTNTLVVFHEPDRGERGPYTLSCNDCRHGDVYVPGEATARSRIGKLRSIVREHHAQRIDGFLVDATTASLLVAVYDTLTPANRELFGKPRLDKLVDLAWKVAV